MSIKWDDSEIRSLTASFNDAGGRIGSRVRDAVRKAGADVQAQAIARVPVDTGFLRSSISMEMAGNAHFSSVEIGPTAHYGRYVEQGTSRPMAAQPYMVPALDAVEPGFVAAMGQLGAEVIQ